MAIIRDYKEVAALYKKAGARGWVIPCFCAENLTTAEAVLAAAADFGKEKGIGNIPITLALTIQYPHRPQASYYTHTRDWRTGLDLFTAQMEVLAGPSGYYSDLDVMLHLDHVQHDLDLDVVKGDLSAYSSIMYDASALPFEENIAKTKAFAEQVKGRIFVEGACDEIFDADGKEHNAITRPEHAERYFRETRVDLIVANLGTEHRASAKDLKYYSTAARAIKQLIGPHIVLHGTSSVSNDQVALLYEDGICKVNIWTALERDASPVLLEEMIRHAVMVGGPDAIRRLKNEQYLGQRVSGEGSAMLSHFTTVYRQDIIFNEMKKIVRGYLDMWYKTI